MNCCVQTITIVNAGLVMRGAVHPRDNWSVALGFGRQVLPIRPSKNAETPSVDLRFGPSLDRLHPLGQRWVQPKFDR